MDDITLTFDSTPFLKSFDDINKGINNMNQKFENFGRTVTEQGKKVSGGFKNTLKNVTGFKAASKGIGAVVKGIGAMAKGLAVFNLAAQGVQRLATIVPEISRTMSIAGSIMLRNFMWPLRKMLLPMLQKFLDWVRDNRALFVKWGQVVVNIFRVVFRLVKGVFNLLKGLWNRISKGIEEVFGKTVNSMTELVNLAIFKIAAIAEFILITLEPVFKFIGDLFIAAMKSVKQFFEGFKIGLGDLSPALDDLFNSIGRIGGALGRMGVNTNNIIKSFRILGTLLGAVIGPIVRTLVTLIDGLAAVIEIVSNKIERLSAVRSNNLKKVRQLDKQLEKINSGFLDRLDSRVDRQKQAWKEGFEDVVKTAKSMKRGNVEVVKKTNDNLTREQRVQKQKVNQINKTTNINRSNNSSNFMRGQNKTYQTFDKRRSPTNNNVKSTNKINNVKSTSNRIKNTTNNTTRTKQNVNITNNININGAKEPRATASEIQNKMRDDLLEAKFRSGGK